MARRMYFDRMADGSVRVTWSGNAGRRDQTLSTDANGLGVSTIMGSGESGRFVIDARFRGLWRAGAYSLWVTESLSTPPYTQTSASKRVAIEAAKPLPAPTGVSARRVGSGVEVTFSAAGSPWVTGWALYTESSAGALTHVQTAGGTVRRFVVSPAPTGEVQYVVRGGGDLTTGIGRANRLPALQAPATPSDLSPNGLIVPPGQVGVSWRHNSRDTSEQTAYQLRYRRVGASSWTTQSKTVSAASSGKLWSQTAGTTDVEWQVSTWGAATGQSPWSPSAIISPRHLPSVSITSPPSGQPVTLPTLSVEFAVNQNQGLTNLAWELELRRDGEVVETAQGRGSSSVALSTWLDNGASYTVRVRAFLEGTPGTWASRSFTTDFVQPSPPVVAASWDDTSGGARLTFTSGALDSTSGNAEGWWESAHPGVIVANNPAGTEAVLRFTQDIEELSRVATWEVPLGVQNSILGAGQGNEFMDMPPAWEYRAFDESRGLVATIPQQPTERGLVVSFNTVGIDRIELWAAGPITPTGLGASIRAGIIPPDPLTAYFDIYRSVDDGVTWETVGAELSADGGEILDLEALSFGDTRYRVEAWSTIPSASATEITVTADSHAVWLHALTDTLPPLRMPWNSDTSYEADRDRGVNTFGANRVPWSGEDSGITINYSTIVEEEPDPYERVALRDEILAMAQSPSPVHVHRDPEGHRIYGYLSGPVKASRPIGPGHGPASYQLVETRRPDIGE